MIMRLIFQPKVLIPSILVAGLVLWWAWDRFNPPSGPEARDHATSTRRVGEGLEDPLKRAFTTLAEQSDTGAKMDSLLELRQKLKAMPKDEAVRALSAMLASGMDHPIGPSLVIGPNGVLEAWPTWRTFLLDTLFLTDANAAAVLSRDILSKPSTADEWTVALRNVGRTDTEPATAEFLRQKTEELIRNPEWMANPSVGYLNAFDVLVHVEAKQSLPLLSALIQKKERKDLAHAASLTLDRLVQRAPVDMLSRLAADTALQQSRPEMTAQQFARADLRDPEQMAIVESWLLDPARTGTQLRSFAGVFPNNNRLVSNNLITTEAPQPGFDLAAHDRAVLDIIRAWEADPRFKPVQFHLRTMIQRLEQFTTPSSP